MAPKKAQPEPAAEVQNFLTQEKFDEIKEELEKLTTINSKEIAENME